MYTSSPQVCKGQIVNADPNALSPADITDITKAAVIFMNPLPVGTADVPKSTQPILLRTKTVPASNLTSANKALAIAATNPVGWRPSQNPPIFRELRTFLQAECASNGGHFDANLDLLDSI